ncbi:hypothetical protein ACFE04_025830 [Oxalis oulophora]
MASHSWLILTAFLVLSCVQSDAQLSPSFYDQTCPAANKIIQKVVEDAVSEDRRMAASLIRLHFHDCFVQGCDASVLLDGTAAFQNEDLALQNKNFRGKNFIAEAKAQLENACPGVFSCADILAVAARDASKAVGGPTWEVKLGRRDSTVANLTQASNDLPKFFMGLDQLIALFNRKGLTARDMVALIGAHTIGQAPCITFRPRVYDNSSDIDAEFAASKRDMCPFTPPEGDLNLAPFDPITPTTFDNNFYKNLLIKKGLIASDQVLFSGGSTDSIVKEYSEDASKFYSDFAVAIVKLGDMLPLTGSEGIIRKVCNVVN